MSDYAIWDDSGYDRDDPKHPSYGDRWLELVDIARKREKEYGPPKPPQPESKPEDNE